MTLRLWLVRETAKARLYSKTPADGADGREADCIWVPRSIVEHTTKRGAEHYVKLPDWFAEREGL